MLTTSSPLSLASPVAGAFAASPAARDAAATARNDFAEVLNQRQRQVERAAPPPPPTQAATPDRSRAPAEPGVRGDKPPTPSAWRGAGRPTAADPAPSPDRRAEARGDAAEAAAENDTPQTPPAAPQTAARANAGGKPRHATAHPSGKPPTKTPDGTPGDAETAGAAPRRASLIDRGECAVAPGTEPPPMADQARVPDADVNADAAGGAALADATAPSQAALPTAEATEPRDPAHASATDAAASRAPGAEVLAFVERKAALRDIGPAGRPIDATGATGAGAGIGLAWAPGAQAMSATPPTSVAVATPLGAPEFSKALGAQVAILAQDGVQRAELQLNPAEMGPVSVRIVIEGGEARIDFGADALDTRKAIEAGLPELATALRDAGLTLTGGGVSQHSSRQQPGDAPGERHGPDSGVRAGADDTVAGEAPNGVVRRRVALGGVDLYA